MVDSIAFTNNVATTITFNVFSPIPIPLHSIKFENNTRNDRRTRSQRHGRWPGLFYIDECLIHLEGEILGTDPGNCNANKLTVVSAILPDPTAFPVIQDKLGVLTIQLTGMTETASADVTIDGDIDTEIAAGDGFSPSRVPFAVTFVAAEGYFVGNTSGNPYILK